MGIKQAVESILGNNEPVKESETVEEEVKHKAKRKTKDKFQEQLKTCIDVLEEEQSEMLEDVDGDLSRVGGERLARYYDFDRVLKELRQHVK